MPLWVALLCGLVGALVPYTFALLWALTVADPDKWSNAPWTLCVESRLTAQPTRTRGQCRALLAVSSRAPVAADV